MAWSTPRTWTTNELVTASVMNTHVRDNLNALKSPPGAIYQNSSGSSLYTTSSTIWTDVDATNLKLTLTPDGTVVFVQATVDVKLSSEAYYVYFSFGLNGVWTAGGTYGLARSQHGKEVTIPLFFDMSATAGVSNYYTLRWKVSDGAATATIYGVNMRVFEGR